MKYPLKNTIHEKLSQEKNIFDTELLKELTENGYEISMTGLNNTLLHMEIAGLITTRWVGKSKRRIELVEKKFKDPDNRA